MVGKGIVTVKSGGEIHNCAVKSNNKNVHSYNSTGTAPFQYVTPTIRTVPCRLCGFPTSSLRFAQFGDVHCAFVFLSLSMNVRLSGLGTSHPVEKARIAKICHHLSSSSVHLFTLRFICLSVLNVIF